MNLFFRPPPYGLPNHLGEHGAMGGPFALRESPDPFGDDRVLARRTSDLVQGRCRHPRGRLTAAVRSALTKFARSRTKHAPARCGERRVVGVAHRLRDLGERPATVSEQRQCSFAVERGHLFRYIGDMAARRQPYGCCIDRRCTARLQPSRCALPPLSSSSSPRATPAPTTKPPRSRRRAIAQAPPPANRRSHKRMSGPSAAPPGLRQTLSIWTAARGRSACFLGVTAPSSVGLTVT